MKDDEIGCVRVWLKEDGSAFILHPDCWDSVLAAWQQGETFYTGRDCYDEPVTIKLGQVVVISRNTPEKQRQAREDRAADKLRDGDA